MNFRKYFPKIKSNLIIHELLINQLIKITTADSANRLDKIEADIPSRGCSTMESTKSYVFAVITNLTEFACDNGEPETWSAKIISGTGPVKVDAISGGKN